MRVRVRVRARVQVQVQVQVQVWETDAVSAASSRTGPQLLAYELGHCPAQLGPAETKCENGP